MTIPQAALVLVITFTALCGVGIWLSRPSRNRRRKGVLKAPSNTCNRSPDWRVHAARKSR